MQLSSTKKVNDETAPKFKYKEVDNFGPMSIKNNTFDNDFFQLAGSPSSLLLIDRASEIHRLEQFSEVSKIVSVDSEWS